VRALACLALLGLGCTVTRFDHQACTRNSDCRSAFGFGAVCNVSEGLCEDAKNTQVAGMTAGPGVARCTTTFPDDLFAHPERYKDPIVIGSLMDHSSAAHLVREKAIKLAVKEASEENGNDGRPLAVVLCDIAQKSEYDALTRPAAAVACANYLSGSLGVAAIVGPSASGDTQQVWEAMRAKGTVVISPAATSPSLLNLEPTSSDSAPGFLWRVAPPDSLQGAVIADDIAARKVTNVAVVREAGAYGEGLAQVFQERFSAAGGTVTILSVTADTQIGEATATVAASPAGEVLFISSQQDWVVKFLNAASGQAGYDGKNIFLTDAAANQSVLTGAASAARLFPRVRGTRPAPRDARDYVFASFVANYKAEYGGEDPTAATFSHHAYDAAWLALYGSAWSRLQEKGAVSGLGIARGLRHVSNGAMPLPIIPSSWATVVNAFRTGAAVNLSGASGELDFDPVTRNVVAPIEIWSIENGAIAHVDTKTP
jgi:ABC-type branched-subunit amino acid transport system substrate-binding protein